MNTSPQLSWHIKRTLILGAPVVLAQVLQMLIGVTDVLMVTQLGELPLAQISLGAATMFFLILVAVGLSIPVAPIIGTALAQKNEQTVRRAVRMGIWQAVLLCFILIPVAFFSREIFTILRQIPAVAEGASDYIDVAMWALPFIFVMNVLRGYLLALERNTILMLISILGVIVNIIGNYALIFGHFGAPRLGLVGSAWATLFTNASMFLATLIIAYYEPVTRRVALFRNPWRGDREMFWRLLRLGLPTTLGLLSEVMLFQFALVMTGWIGVSEQAAYGLVLQIASVTFMIPLGLSIVASVRASQAIGHENRDELILVAKSTMIVITGVMIVTAFLFIAWPHQILSLLIDIDDPKNTALVALSVSYLACAAAFQISDGAQVGGISLLRGMQDMLVPAILAFIAYWCIGAPSAYLLAFTFGLEGQGLWWGLVIGLSAAAIALWGRFWMMTRKENFAERCLQT